MRAPVDIRRRWKPETNHYVVFLKEIPIIILLLNETWDYDFMESLHLNLNTNTESPRVTISLGLGKNNVTENLSKWDGSYSLLNWSESPQIGVKCHKNAKVGTEIIEIV